MLNPQDTLHDLVLAVNYIIAATQAAVMFSVTPNTTFDERGDLLSELTYAGALFMYHKLKTHMRRHNLAVNALAPADHPVMALDLGTTQPSPDYSWKQTACICEVTKSFINPLWDFARGKPLNDIPWSMGRLALQSNVCRQTA